MRNNSTTETSDFCPSQNFGRQKYFPTESLTRLRKVRAVGKYSELKALQPSSLVVFRISDLGRATFRHNATGTRHLQNRRARGRGQIFWCLPSLGSSTISARAKRTERRGIGETLDLWREPSVSSSGASLTSSERSLKDVVSQLWG